MFYSKTHLGVLGHSLIGTRNSRDSKFAPVPGINHSRNESRIFSSRADGQTELISSLMKSRNSHA